MPRKSTTKVVGRLRSVGRDLSARPKRGAPAKAPGKAPDVTVGSARTLNTGRTQDFSLDGLAGKIADALVNKLDGPRFHLSGISPEVRKERLDRLTDLVNAGPSVAAYSPSKDESELDRLRNQCATLNDQIGYLEVNLKPVLRAPTPQNDTRDAPAPSLTDLELLNRVLSEAIERLMVLRGRIIL